MSAAAFTYHRFHAINDPLQNPDIVRRVPQLCPIFA